ncbi:MAG: hypothetical protein KDE15_00245 [Erythrobacter sp.]|nr:hypothetical protein [Erythrobacter sp.]
MPVAAQDFNASPNYETVQLRGGFPDDPYIVYLSSGGGVDASNLGGGCRGYIANAPDVRLNFEPGSLPLIISAASGADTTLVINAPDGRWYCDDDSGEGLNPSVLFSNPQYGRYEIWVGTYGNAQLYDAELHISELYSQ